MEVKIYTLSSSSNPDNIRYVGKTTENLNKRLSGHLTLAKRNAAIGYYHNHTSNWINSTLNKGDKVLIKELDIVNIKGWDFWEKYWISQFKTWGFNLTNLTDGGDGNQNMHFSPESNLARSKALLGTHRPKEVKLKISKGNLGKKKYLGKYLSDIAFNPSCTFNGCSLNGKSSLNITSSFGIESL